MHRTLSFIAAILLLLGAVTPALAAPASVSVPHNLRFEHLTIEDGLSQNAVLSTLQDSRGYLWIGTQDGLNRYDGVSFITYRNETGNPQSISHSSILSLAEDKAGFLWIGTWGGGLNKFDPVTETFTAFKHNPQDLSSLSDDTVTALLVDRDGALWVGTLGGLNRMNPDGTFAHYQNNPGNPYSLSGDNISCLLQAPDGAIWIGTGFLTDGGGLSRMNNDGTFTRYQNDPANPASIASNNVSSLLIDKSGTMWVGTGGYGLLGAGLDKLNPNGTFSHYKSDPSNPDSLAADNIMSIYQDASGVIWLGTWGGGVDLFDPSLPEPRFSHAHNNPYDASSLSADIVWNVNGDRSGVIWIGTLNGGLNKFAPLTAQFTLYQHNPSDPESLGFNVIGGFYEDHFGNLWINTWGGGLEFFDQYNGKFKHYRHDPNNPKSLIADNVMTIYQDSMETFWVGTMNGLTKFDRNADTFTPVLHDPSNPNSTISDSITKILDAAPGKIWIATMGGLDLYDYFTNTYTHYINDPRDPKSLSNNSIVSMFKDRAGTLWLGTWGGGLNRMNADGTFTRFNHDPQRPSSISEDSIWVIEQDSKGYLWIGTQIGLNRMNPDGTFTAYHMKDGLPNETIMGILEDNSGKLWISTGNGLARFDPQEEIFKVFDARDGLQSNEFDSSAYYKDHQGRLYFGGIHGFNVFDPKNISENNVPPLVAISRFLIFNQPVQTDLSGKTRLEVPYWQNFIAFEFAALDFHAPSKNQYAYKLEGFDQDWVNAGSRRYASYTNLPGGNYTFRVKAANNDGVWNEQGVSIPITVTPPFWGTWWFQGGVVLLVIGMLAAGYTARVRGIQEQKKALETEVAERTEELRLAQKELARRAEEELSVSEARFRAVFDSSAVGIAIMSLDRKIIEANPAMCKGLGRSPEELVNTTPDSVIFRDDYPQATQEFQDLLDGKLDHHWAERRYVRKDGEIFWTSVTMSIVRDLNGTPRYVVSMVIDIDQRKRMQETIRDSEARFRAMFDNASVGIALMTLQRRVVSLNQTAINIIGYPAEELKDKDASDLSHPDDRLIGADRFAEILSGESQGFQMEKRFVRKNGSIFWGRVTYSVVPGQDGKPVYLIGLIEDITEQRETREKLAEQEQKYRAQLEQRVEERTHELAGANMRLRDEIEQRQRAEQALATKAAEEAVIAERTRLARDLHDAVTQTLFSASLIAEVLPDLWKMDEAEALRSTEELRQLTRGALAEMRTLLLELRPAALTQARFGDLLKQLTEALIGRARLPIRLTVEGERSLPPEVQVALYRIAQESLNNVFKYARATQVDVNLMLSPAGVHLEISDNGIGFDMSLLKPTSLGMRIMRERAEAIHADFEVSSNPGEGTHVSVTWNAE